MPEDESRQRAEDLWWKTRMVASCTPLLNESELSEAEESIGWVQNRRWLFLAVLPARVSSNCILIRRAWHACETGFIRGFRLLRHFEPCQLPSNMQLNSSTTSQTQETTCRSFRLRDHTKVREPTSATLLHPMVMNPALAVMATSSRLDQAMALADSLTKSERLELRLHMARTTNAEHPLFLLPAELRNEIYRLTIAATICRCIVDDDCDSDDEDYSATWGFFPRKPEFFDTCRQICSEARTLFYNKVINVEEYHRHTGVWELLAQEKVETLMANEVHRGGRHLDVDVARKTVATGDCTCDRQGVFYFHERVHQHVRQWVWRPEAMNDRRDKRRKEFEDLRARYRVASRPGVLL